MDTNFKQHIYCVTAIYTGTYTHVLYTTVALLTPHTKMTAHRTCGGVYYVGTCFVHKVDIDNVVFLLSTFKSHYTPLTVLLSFANIVHLGAAAVNSDYLLLQHPPTYR